MALVVYDSYEKKKRRFEPLHAGKVSIYTCGLTVYGPMHIGHASTYMRWDAIREYLQYWKGYKVTLVRNITDFGHMTEEETDSGEDKIKKGMKRENLTADQLTQKYIDDYFKCSDNLKIERPDESPRATKFVPQMIKYIHELLKKGYAYEAGGNVYFDVAKLGKRYGKLSGMSVDQLKVGAGGHTEEDTNKRNHFDFVLWKAHRPEHAYKWNSPWGEGMPGWHTECIVMSEHYFGKEFDIKAGGMDNKVPHHECEIAQSVAMQGKPQAKYFFHTGLVTINGEKMAKSKGNFITAADLLKKESPGTLRIWAFSSHYRSAIDFDQKSIDQAKKTVETLNRLTASLQATKGKDSNPNAADAVNKADADFTAAMDDDFNTPLALSVLHDLAHKLNALNADGNIGKQDAKKALDFLKRADRIFKVIDFTQKKEKVPSAISELAKARERARAAKDWKRADELRVEISKQGWTVQDTPTGPKLEKAS
ncbi:cysteine--tRNA ligase [Candidatus Micrarchaeota archaeon]|nr:cysteine--tRNA ligase [Candidatus Micrarchaeota archaeon]